MLQCGIAPDYVLDRMQFYEIETLIENMWRKNKDSWEQTRTLGYITAQSQSTKKIDMQSMMSFPWEKGEPDDTPTQEERDALMKEMKEMEEKMNRK